MSESPAVIGHPEQIGLCTRTLFGHRQLSSAEIIQVIDATADAGFGEVSIWTAHMDWAAADGVSEPEFLERHRDRGLRIATAEIVMDWTENDPKKIKESSEAVLRQTVAADAPHVIAITMERTLPSLTETAAGMGYLCDLAADAGRSVSFEFLPFCAIPTIADAARLLDAVDRENFGLVLDASHWLRQPGGPDYDALSQIPGDRIHGLQLADLPAVPAEDPMMETGSARLLPGDGAADVVRLLDALAALGARPVVTSEVFSSELMARGPSEFAQLQFDAMLRVLREHWSETR